MSSIKISAPGKLHLLGEHAVVYNKPAILAAVDKRCFVEITPRKDNKIQITSRNYKSSILRRIEEVKDKFEKAQKDWEIYNKNNDTLILKSITKDFLDYPQIIIGQFLNFYKLKSIKGFDLTIDSEIPVGCGMGSSGALSVSMIGALSLFVNKPLEKEEINKIAFLCEQKKHGNPSGGDSSTSCFGGLVWFKKDEELKPLDAVLPEEVAKNFYIINTGIPSETTGEMVSFVRNQILNSKKKKERVEEIFNGQELLVQSLISALEQSSHEDIIRIISDGEKNLEKLGVVSSFVQKIIRDIEKSGGAAKICGAGGTTKATGIILIYNKDLRSLEKVLKSHRFVPAQLTLGVEGLRKE